MVNVGRTLKHSALVLRSDFTHMRTQTTLEAYLEQTLGQDIELRPAGVRGLPIYLDHAYKLWRTRVFGREFVLAEARADYEGGRARLAADLEALQRAAPDSHVALVLPHLAPLQ